MTVSSFGEQKDLTATSWITFPTIGFDRSETGRRTKILQLIGRDQQLLFPLTPGIFKCN